MIAAARTEDGVLADALITSLSRVCRQVGTMVAEVETSLIDNAQLPGGISLPPEHLQKMDMILQSIEELALLLDRLDPIKGDIDPVMVSNIVAPVKLGWIRAVLHDDPTYDAPDRPADEDVMLF